MANIMDLFKKIATEKAPPSPITHLLVGLGNPGKKYEGTRHNAGFSALDFVAQAYGVRVDRLRFHALCGEGMIGTHRVLFMKPQTFMNASGLAVQEAAEYYRIPPENILVISDDITQKPGRIRIRKSGSAGGHNGLKDLIACLGTEAFPRIRLGVGEKPHPDYDLADWVTSEMGEADRSDLASCFPSVKEGIALILDRQFDAAQQLCNSHTPPKKGIEDTQ